MRKMILMAAVLFASQWSLSANVSLSATLNQSVSASAQTVFNNEIQNLQNSINSQYQTSSQSTLQDYLGAAANAQSMSNKGLGVDYTSNRSLFVVGAGAGVGANLGGKSLTDFANALKGNQGLPQVGLATQANGMVGLSLAKFAVPKIGPVDLKKLTLFVNFLGLSIDQIKPYTMKTSAFGLHAQYRVIEAKSFGFGTLNWMGLDLGTGVDFSSNTIGMSQSFPGITSGNLTWNPTGTMSLTSNSFSIPVEVSTGIRLLYILTLFGGVGADFQYSVARINASMTGAIDANVSGTGTVNNVGTATLNFNESKNGNIVGVRTFIGTAVNIVPLKNTNVVSVFAMANIGTAGYGFNLGARMAW